MVGGLSVEVPKYPQRALHLSGSEAKFGRGGVKHAPYFFWLSRALLDLIGDFLAYFGVTNPTFSKKKEKNSQGSKTGRARKKNPTESRIQAWQVRRSLGVFKEPRMTVVHLEGVGGW